MLQRQRCIYVAESQVGVADLLLDDLSNQVRIGVCVCVCVAIEHSSDVCASCV